MRDDSRQTHECTNAAFVAHEFDVDCGLNYGQSLKLDISDGEDFNDDGGGQVSIAWHNLRFEVPNVGGLASLGCGNRRKVPILRRLTGSFGRGSLNGLMGPSGAGKSTLLNVLAGIDRSGLTAESELWFNNNNNGSGGDPVNPVIYFVPQHVHETLLGPMTVGDILRYAYAFKQSSGSSGSNGSAATTKREERIRRLLDELMLPASILDRTFRHCSGGEQRRVAIGQELVGDRPPDLLLLDEPTTGLDSAAAFQVVSCLRQMVTRAAISTQSSSLTVIASVHSPNQPTLALFHQLYVLARGGVCLYSGPPSAISTQLPPTTATTTTTARPPIESLLELACTGTADPVVRSMSEHTLRAEHQKLTPAILTHLNPIPRNSTAHQSFRFGNLATQLRRLFHLSFVANARFTLLPLVFYLCYFIFIGTVFSADMASGRGCYVRVNSVNDSEEGDFVLAGNVSAGKFLAGSTNRTCSGGGANSGLDEDGKVKENVQFMFYLHLMVSFLAMCTGAVFYGRLIRVFRSEHRNRWYSLGTFFWSMNAVSLAELTLNSLFVSVVSYALTNQMLADNGSWNWTRFGYFYLFLFLLSVYNASIGHLVSLAMIEHVELAVVVCQLLGATATLINGFYVKLNRSTYGRSLEGVSEAAAFVHLTRGMLAAVYGIDRCEPGLESSWILEENLVETDRIHYYVGRAVVNIVLVKLASLVMLWLKFGSFFPGSKQSRKPQSNNDHRHHATPMIELDWNKNEQETLENNTSESRSPDTNPLPLSEQQKTINDALSGKILIAWRDLTLLREGSLFESGTETDSGRAGPILRALNGELRFGTLVGLMGTSGAGKTSLLRVLNGQCKSRLDGRSRFFLSAHQKIETAYLTQEVDHHLMPGLTALQTLTYASRLKNVEHEASAEERIDHVTVAKQVLARLDLTAIAATEVSRCSGGERKRLALATELTARQMPNLICIDEPTSGLDTNSSQIVVDCLARLTAQCPITLVCSVHQPTSSLLSAFHQLYVLARGGTCIYSGPPSAISTHLAQARVPSKLGTTKSTTTTTTGSETQLFPLETLIEHACRDHTDPVVQALAEWHNRSYRTIPALENTEGSLLAQQLAADTELIGDGVVRNRPRFRFASVRILVVRFGVYIARHQWLEWSLSIVGYLCFGLALTVFYDGARMVTVPGCLNPLEDELNQTACSAAAKTPEKLEEESLLADNFKYTYFSTNILLFVMMLQSTVGFYREYHHFEAEHRNGWYSSGAFYLTKSIWESAPLVPLMLLYVYIVDIAESVAPAPMYRHLVPLFILATAAVQGMAHCFALAGFADLTVLTVVTVTVYITSMVVGNFYLPVKSMHYVYQLVANFSIVRFTFEAVLLLQYGFGRCSRKQVQPILYQMEITDDDYAVAVAMLVVNLVFYRLVAVALLVRRANPIENRRRRVQRVQRFGEKLRRLRWSVAEPGLANCGRELKIQVVR